jgi:hypothetical protein
VYERERGKRRARDAEKEKEREREIVQCVCMCECLPSLLFAHRKKDAALVSFPSVPPSVQKGMKQGNCTAQEQFVVMSGAHPPLPPVHPLISTLLSPTAKHLRSSTNTIAGTIPTDMRTCCKVDIKWLAERWFKPKAQELEHITRSVAIQL